MYLPTINFQEQAVSFMVGAIVNPTIVLLILSFGVNGKSVRFGGNGKCFFFCLGRGKKVFP